MICHTPNLHNANLLETSARTKPVPCNNKNAKSRLHSLSHGSCLGWPPHSGDRAEAFTCSNPCMLYMLHARSPRFSDHPTHGIVPRLAGIRYVTCWAHSFAAGVGATGWVQLVCVQACDARCRKTNAVSGERSSTSKAIQLEASTSSWFNIFINSAIML